MYFTDETQTRFVICNCNMANMLLNRGYRITQIIPDEKNKINNYAKKYNMEFDFKDKYTYDVIGCKECNMTGYSGRIAIIEILTLTDKIKELIMDGKSTFEIRKAALEEGFLPFEMDGIKKVVDGKITLQELNNKTLLFNS